jgi:hypothetical protein
VGVDSDPIAEELAQARLSAALRERLTGISATPDGEADGNADGSADDTRRMLALLAERVNMTELAKLSDVDSAGGSGGASVCRHRRPAASCAWYVQ